MARKISKARANAIKHGYRSGFEHKVADQLTEAKIKYQYEKTVINYIKPETNHRKKHLLIKSQHPELDIRMVFQNSKGKIRKGSKTTYADFCDKNGIMWADKQIPKEWYTEKK